MKLNLRLLLIAFIASLIPAIPANAQLGVYANFSAAKINFGDNSWIYGPGFGAYIDHGHFVFLSTGIDARGVVLGTGSSTKFDAGYIGPRIALRPHVLPIKPYVEGLVGVGHAEFNSGSVQSSSTDFSYQLVGGIDYTLLPRIDWRVVEFSYGGLSVFDSSLHPKTISTGIVIRLPGVL
jgi:hypothetical protein